MTKAKAEMESDTEKIDKIGAAVQSWHIVETAKY